MTDQEFWAVIGRLDDPGSFNEEREDDAADAIVARLLPFGIDELQSFEEQLAEKLHRLDTKQHHDASGDSAGSGDGFLYCRCFVVASGKPCYEDVLSEPDRMPKKLDHWFETLLSVGATAFATLTGSDADDWLPETILSYETGSNTAGWPE